MILLYHKVHPTSPTQWWVTADDFYRQMAELQGRRVVSLDEYDPRDPEQVVITFDGVYDNVLTFAAPVLRRFGYPFELFVSGEHIGRANEFDAVEPPARFAGLDELRALQALGGRLQWHGRSHLDLGAAMDAAVIAAELEVPRELRAAFGEGSFRWFAYPHGGFSAAARAAAQRGFRGALSCVQGGDDDPFALNRLTVTNETRLRRRTISAIVVSHNYGVYLPEAVETVLRQTLPADEVLLVDDASTDETPEIAAGYAARNPGLVRSLRNPENLGIVGTFNRAVRESRGELIVFLGADNRMPSNYLEACYRCLETTGAAIAYTDYVLFGRRAPLYYAALPEPWRGPVVDGRCYRIVFPSFASPEATLAEIARRNFIHGSAMYTRVGWERAGGYGEGTLRAEDHQFFERMLRAGLVARKAEGTFLEYRQHSKEQANIRQSAYALLSFYMGRTRELERELAFLKRTFPYNLLGGVARAHRALREDSAGVLLRKILRRLTVRGRRGAAG
jgi:glycosyltransferase involved in cell wall biosynthesis